MDQTLVLLIALPSILAIIVGFLRRDCGATALTLSVLYAVIASMLVVTVFMISKATEVADVEIWNGQVTAKKREHSSYDQTYECHCITVQGPNNTTNRVCQTCTRASLAIQEPGHGNIVCRSARKPELPLQIGRGLINLAESSLDAVGIRGPAGALE